MNEITLKQTQDWMMTLLAVRGDLQQKITTASAHTKLPFEQLAEGDAGAVFYRRLNVYAAGYVMRLVECLKSEYRVLEGFMGEEVFAGFAKAYIVTLPSTNPSLYDLGDGFARFLAKTRPKANNGPEEEAFFSLPTEIARVERARAEVSLAKGFETSFLKGHVSENQAIEKQDIEKQDIENQSIKSPAIKSPVIESNVFLDQLSFLQQNTRLETPECLRLIQLDYPVLPLMAQVESGEEPNMPTASLNWVGLSRVQYQLRMVSLEQWQYDFLTVCQTERDLPRCIERTSASSGLDAGDLHARLMFWLPTAVSHGLLRMSN